MENASGGKNVLCVAFIQSPASMLVLCGGVDGFVNGYSCVNGVHKLQYQCSSPVLSIDTNGSWIASATMGGSLAIVNYIPQVHMNIIAMHFHF